MSETKAVPEAYRARMVAAKAQIGATKAAIGDLEVRYLAQKQALLSRISADDAALQALARDAAVAVGIDPAADTHVFDWGALEFRPAAPVAEVKPKTALVPRRHVMSMGAGKRK